MGLRDGLIFLGFAVLVHGCTSPQDKATGSWRTWTGWSADCPVSVWTPRDGGEPPAAIEWQPCVGQGCQQMSISWGRDDSIALGVQPKFHAPSSDLLFSRLSIAGGGDPKSYKEWIWGNRDGTVYAAMRQPYPEDPKCTFIEEDVTGDRAAFLVRGSGRNGDSAVDGLIIWDRGGSQPQVLARDDSSTLTRWTLTSLGPVGVAAPQRVAWLLNPLREDRQEVLGGQPDEDGLRLGQPRPVAVDDGLLLEVGRLDHRALMKWDADKGVQPWRRFSRADGRSAGNLGCDRDWLVWTEGRRTKTQGLFDTHVMARRRDAIDAIDASPRQIAQDGNPSIGAAPFVVGCDLAAHGLLGGVQVVRLSDGRSTTIGEKGHTFADVLGIDCNEVTAVSFVDGQPNIRRWPVPGILL